MAQKIASAYIKLDADSIEFVREIKKAANETRRFATQARRNMNRAQYAFNRMRRVAQLFASAFIIVGTLRQLGRLAVSIEAAEDKMSLMTARFRQFGREANTLQQVYQLSQRLGTSLEETASGMTRLLVATKSLGTSQKDLLKVQENIFVLARAGGTSTEELVGGMRQLSQGLASGRLQGEELRSVLENIPLVALEIADELDVPIGKIRELAAEGKITGDVVINALKEIGINFEDLPQTFAQSTQRIRTEWSLLLAELGRRISTSSIATWATEAIQEFRTAVLNDFTLFNEGQILQEIENVKAKLKQIDPENQSVLSVILDAGDEIDLNQRLDALYKSLDAVVAQKDLLFKLQSANEVKDALDADTEALERYQKELSSFLRQFETDQQRVTRRLAELFRFAGDISADELERIRFEIEKDLIQEIDTSLLPKLKEIPEKAKESFEEMSQYGKQAARNIQSAFADFLFDPLEEGLDGLLRNFVNVIRRIMAEMLASQILGGGVGTAIGNLFGLPGKAMGGPVTAGRYALHGWRARTRIIHAALVWNDCPKPQARWWRRKRQLQH